MANFSLPEGCMSLFLDKILYREEVAYCSPDQRIRKFVKDVLESTYPLKHLCRFFYECPEDIRRKCEESISLLRGSKMK